MVAIIDISGEKRRENLIGRGGTVLPCGSGLEQAQSRVRVRLRGLK